MKVHKGGYMKLSITASSQEEVFAFLMQNAYIKI